MSSPSPTDTHLRPYQPKQHPVINQVLLPQPVFFTISEALGYYRTTQRLKALIESTPSLAAAAANPRSNLTLFAPRDEAFMRNPAIASYRLPPVTALVIPGARFLPRGFENGEAVKTLAGPSIGVKFTVDPTTKASQALVGPVGGGSSSSSVVARVEQMNVIAGRSVIHGIDRLPFDGPLVELLPALSPSGGAAAGGAGNAAAAVAAGGAAATAAAPSGKPPPGAGAAGARRRLLGWRLVQLF